MKRIWMATLLAGLGGSLALAAQPLIVYSAQGYDRAVVNAFVKATGIPAELVDSSTGPLIARVEAQKQHPQWGVVWFDGAEAMRALADQGLLLKHFEPKVQWNALGRDVVPADGAYVPVSATFAGILVVNTKVIAPAQIPTTWKDLLKPEYRGLVGMNNPAISGPTYPLVAGLFQSLGGTKAGKAYFEALKKNGLHVYDTNGVTLRALFSGAIGIAIVQSSAGVGALLKHEPVKLIYPNPVSLLPGDIGIDAQASPQVISEAKKFVDFVMSKAGQRVMQTGDPGGDSNFYPIVQGENPKVGVTPVQGIHFQKVDPLIWGPKESAINTWFTNNIVH
jgi:iron(III) transport system substrate-binding protein